MDTKCCYKCGSIKELACFYGNKSNKDGKCNHCKTCREARKKVSYEKNKETISSQRKLKYEKNKETISAQRKLYYEKASKETISAQRKVYYRANKQKVLGRVKVYIRGKLRSDPAFRVLFCLRKRLRCAMISQGAVKVSATMDLVGCTRDELMLHFQNQFKDGMSWNNYGSGLNKWSVDHIKPCARFNLLDEAEQKACFHRSNLQPLWWFDNLAKGKKYETLEALEALGV
jgi:hypothetical protein